MLEDELSSGLHNWLLICGRLVLVVLLELPLIELVIYMTWLVGFKLRMSDWLRRINITAVNWGD